MKYYVEVIEQKSVIVEVEAKTPEDAEGKAQYEYNNGRIVVDGGVIFDAWTSTLSESQLASRLMTLCREEGVKFQSVE